jgi:hypothetical protein
MLGFHASLLLVTRALSQHTLSQGSPWLNPLHPHSLKEYSRKLAKETECVAARARKRASESA